MHDQQDLGAIARGVVDANRWCRRWRPDIPRTSPDIHR